MIVGDVIDGLRTLPDESVQCCVTSPPYWGLRDYGVEGQLGLEATPAEFVSNMTRVFEEVRRVLRPDGTCWVNIGDSYSAHPGQRKETDKAGPKQQSNEGSPGAPSRCAPGLKPKDLVGIPWRLAFALQDAGWYLRSEIIWHKRSPMPESVTDRPTKAHEQIFLLTKSPKYFFDQEAAKEPSTIGAAPQSRQNESFSAAVAGLVASRNVRTVWTISSESFKGAHFATFPSEIPRRAILAGTSEKGCCAKCGAPWLRIVEKDRPPTRPGENSKVLAVRKLNSTPGRAATSDKTTLGSVVGNRDPYRHVTVTVGWKPGCGCDCAETVPCVVLDPFSGSGTSGMVATEMGRVYIGTELNPEYAEMSRKRIDSWKKRDAVNAVVPTAGQRPLFE